MALPGVKQLRQFLSNLITLQAEFVQTLRQPDSDQIYITSGILDPQGSRALPLPV